MHYTGEDTTLVIETEGGRKNLYLDSEILRNKALSYTSCIFLPWEITRRKQCVWEMLFQTQQKYHFQL